MKDELGRKIMTEFAALRPKTYSHLTANKNENEKTKDIKKCAIKRKPKFEDYKNCLEATELENERNHPEKNKINIDSLKEQHKDFIKNKINSSENYEKTKTKSIKSFRSKKHNILTEEVNKIA